MATHRPDRVAEDIRRCLPDIMRSMKDPRISGLLSIVKLDLAGDYSHCKVYISAVEGFEQAKQAVQGLNSGAGYIRREVDRYLSLRRSPAFHFVADNSIEHSSQISKMLDVLLPDNQPQGDDHAD